MSDKQEPNGKGTANITDQEYEWAQQALIEYESKDYKACLEYLERIEEARPNDPKVLLNKAIVEFYDSGLCTTDKFQKSFVDVCKQVWSLCHLIPCHLFNIFILKSPLYVLQIELNLEQLDSLEDVENCIYYYNHAVLLYHLKHYTKALAVINKVYSFIESLGNQLFSVQIINMCRMKWFSFWYLPN